MHVVGCEEVNKKGETRRLVRRQKTGGLKEARNMIVKYSISTGFSFVSIS